MAFVVSTANKLAATVFSETVAQNTGAVEILSSTAVEAVSPIMVLAQVVRHRVNSPATQQATLRSLHGNFLAIHSRSSQMI
jgi:hypothetical protein